MKIQPDKIECTNCDNCDYMWYTTKRKSCWMTKILEKGMQIYSMTFNTEEEADAFGIGFIKGLMAAKGLK
jgi:hypothetical protein